jgi:hypothetical protein
MSQGQKRQIQGSIKKVQQKQANISSFFTPLTQSSAKSMPKS